MQTVARWTAVALLTCMCGCVERLVVISTVQPGADVFVDERFIGTTDAEGLIEFPFKHYGTRRFRAGPVHDEKDQIIFGAQEVEKELLVPWFQVFPIDFFTEVLYPGTLVDEHVVLLELTPVAAPVSTANRERALSVLKEANVLRDRALSLGAEGKATE